MGRVFDFMDFRYVILTSGPDFCGKIRIVPDDAAAQSGFCIYFLSVEAGVDGCLVPFTVCLGLDGLDQDRTFFGGKDVVENVGVVAFVFGEPGAFEVDDLFADLWAWGWEEILRELIYVLHACIVFDVAIPWSKLGHDTMISSLQDG